MVRALCDEVIVMQSGKVVERGPASRIFDDPQEQYTKDLLKAAFDVVADSDPVLPPGDTGMAHRVLS